MNNKYRNKDLEKINNWHWLVDLLAICFPIFFSIYICIQYSLWFYPLALLIISQRQVALVALGHEAMHGLLITNRKWNDILGRYICHYPNLVSFSQYKALHLLHHRYIGTQQDPDFYLYNYYPVSFVSWSKNILKYIFSLHLYWDFLKYFTEIPYRINKIFNKNIKPAQKLIKSDFWNYLTFWTFILTFSVFHSWVYELILYWLVPLLFSLPFVHLQNALEHGNVNSESPNETRSITSSYGLTKYFLPLNLHYHCEHHLNPNIPHYNLLRYSQYLQYQGILTSNPDLNINLLQALKKVFHK